MTPIKMNAFAHELTKTAKPRQLGTLLGQNVTKTVKRKATGLAKKAGRGMALARGAGEWVSKKRSAGNAILDAVKRHPKKAIAAGAAASFVAGRSSKKK